jgi:oligopeptidase A
MTATLQHNPLLDWNSRTHDGLPRFLDIRAEHVQPAVTQLLAELETELAGLEASAAPTWEGLAVPLERLQDRLEFTWGTVGHVLSVCNSPELRAAHEAAQPEVVQFSMRMGQSRPLYEAFLALRDRPDLSPSRKRIVEAALRDAELSGVGLTGAAKDRFNAIQMDLAEASTRFSNHVLDATKAFALDLTLHSEVEGLPPSLLALAAQTAQAAGHEGATAEHGPWRITLDFPSFGPFMQHSRRRDLREELYRTFVRRASEGELDNTPIIQQILGLRQEMAELLGYADFAALSLASKMAEGPAEVRALLEELRVASYPAGLRDFQELRDFARLQGAAEADELRHWDIAFWAERLREDRYDYSDEQLRPYFPLPKVLEGLFALARRLFGVVITAADGQAPVWHEHVRFFRIAGEDGQPVAAFYLDPYSRPAEKRGGAWMNECLGRTRLFGTPEQPVRLPVAYLVCNQTPPVGNQPSLMTFHEVETLLHEFGHGLQHMLTTVDEGLAAGIRGVEWDAVELPSQFMENWCYHKPTLKTLSGHVETGEPLPDALFDKLTAARTYRAGSDMLRQLMFALTDLQLHHGFDAAHQSPFDVHRQVASRTAVLPPLPEDKFLCAFSHIFAGGYAAGYYSYKWAEVLSADAFSAFEEAGLDDEGAVMATGRRFRDTVLALGGSVHPMEVFTQFRGRPPSTEALLRHAGLL